MKANFLLFIKVIMDPVGSNRLFSVLFIDTGFLMLVFFGVSLIC